MDSKTTVTADQLADFIHRSGRAGALTLSVLGKQKPFVDAMNTEVGRFILADALRVHESLLQKVASLTATDEETMEYSAIRKIILRWSERIAKYEANLSKVVDQG